jgi:hypothetical protein
MRYEETSFEIKVYRWSRNFGVENVTKKISNVFRKMNLGHEKG